MRLFRILTLKELKGYFLTPFGWVVLAFVTIMQGVSLSTAMKGFRDTPVRDSLVYVTFHTPLCWFYFLFIFPLITMRLFAEEERSGTLETLLTAPVRTWQVVFSKYAAAMVFYAVLWVPCVVQFKMFEWATDLPPAFTHGGGLSGFGADLKPDHRGDPDDRAAGHPIFPGIRDDHLGRVVRGRRAVPLHFLAAAPALFRERSAGHATGGVFPEHGGFRAFPDLSSGGLPPLAALNDE